MPAGTKSAIRIAARISRMAAVRVALLRIAVPVREVGANPPPPGVAEVDVVRRRDVDLVTLAGLDLAQAGGARVRLPGGPLGGEHGHQTAPSSLGQSMTGTWIRRQTGGQKPASVTLRTVTWSMLRDAPEARNSSRARNRAKASG